MTTKLLRPVSSGHPSDADVNMFSLRFSTIGEWYQTYKRSKDPDRFRNALYYGFQPIFDCLIEETVPQNRRKNIIALLDEILRISKEFLVHYYAGDKATTAVQTAFHKLKPLVDVVEDVQIRTKQRNIDLNQIYPADVGKFLTKAINLKPDVIIGCACGSSEVVLAYAGFTHAPVFMIRKSKRREDRAAKTVKEQEQAIRAAVKGSRVICIEDFVCYGNSMAGLFQKIKEYHPKELIGASVRYSAEGQQVNNYFKDESERYYLFKES